MSQIVSPVYDKAAGPAHLIEGLSHPGSNGPALCGEKPAWPNYWFGGGTVNEKVRATGMQVCTACTAKWKEMG